MRSSPECSTPGLVFSRNINNNIIMEKQLGQNFKNLAQREAFLKDNCDACEQKGYMRSYTPEELQGHKEKLANISIEIAEIEADKKIVDAHYKERLKPLRESRAIMVSNIKSKAEYVNEVCYRFTDQETRETGYYNKEGNLIECRPATADELQATIFQVVRNTGTDN